MSTVSTLAYLSLLLAMTDFDIIYEERDNEEIASAHTVVVVPDPIIIRGGGNVTM